ncbi:hypothetical protein LX32DRAFT_342508 [Colletotrichum zoysiae]|uniref:Uncharacterized protein n=1 Tax=Colletotrichum zoysiae TaxID=1216348 RepID=A0AAD9HJ84_9PEZI|nr:hypothetical protein LX32DRAFT_342508 [Colletotrichum zoysiae]
MCVLLAATPATAVPLTPGPDDASTLCRVQSLFTWYDGGGKARETIAFSTTTEQTVWQPHQVRMGRTVVELPRGQCRSPCIVRPMLATTRVREGQGHPWSRPLGRHRLCGRTGWWDGTAISLPPSPSMSEVRAVFKNRCSRPEVQVVDAASAKYAHIGYLPT